MYVYLFSFDLELLLIGSRIARVTADILCDDVLLETFDWYLFHDEADDNALDVDAWHTLVHVCRRWRAIVFGSSRRLNLQLFFTSGRSVETLAVWPPLPIIIWKYGNQTQGMDDVIIALKYNDRICEINLLDIQSAQLEDVLAAMQRPFPALTELGLRGDDDYTAAPAVPDSFLDGFAPSLQRLYFCRMPFPALPEFLLSATNLVQLHVWRIPYLGFIPPEVMVNCLSALPKLEVLWLGFESSRSRLYQDSLRTPPIRLPLLTEFKFEGAIKYLENLVAPIDAPLLDSLEITFFYKPVLDTPELLKFVSRIPNVKSPAEAYVDFSYESVSVTLPNALPRKLHLEVLCTPANSQVRSLAQVCGWSYPRFLIPEVERLYITDTEPQPVLEDDIEDDQWLAVLRPFTSVKDLCLSWEIVTRIADSLGERGTEVLPALQNLFLEEPRPLGAVKDAIDQFVAARQLAIQPIAVYSWVGTWGQASEVVNVTSMYGDLSVPGASALDDLSGFGPGFSSSVLDHSDSSVPDGSPVPNYSSMLVDSPVVVDSPMFNDSPVVVDSLMFNDSPVVVDHVDLL